MTLFFYHMLILSSFATRMRCGGDVCPLIGATATSTNEAFFFFSQRTRLPPYTNRTHKKRPIFDHRLCFSVWSRPHFTKTPCSYHGVCFAVISDMLTLERAVYQRCTPRQVPLSDRQWTDRQKCARSPEDFVAASVLPRYTADFPLQLLDFAHTWSARGDNDTDLFDAFPLAAAVYIFIKNRSRVGPSATVSSPTSRTACCNRRTPRQAPTPQRPNVAYSVDNSASYTGGVPHLGGPSPRACNSHVCGLDLYVRTSPGSLGRTTATAAAPEPPRGATNSTG